MNYSKDYHCRWAKSLGELENTHQEIWGTKEYRFPRDIYKPTVFFGLYDIRDYLALRLHRGKKYVLWAGSDIENLANDFLFNNGKLKWLSEKCCGLPEFLAKGLDDAQHYVENDYEHNKLVLEGIPSKVVPSFLGKIDDFPISYKQADIAKVFVSGHFGREKEYGFELVERLAKATFGHCIFYLYGAKWSSKLLNVICCGVNSKEQFNEDLRNYQAGLRLNESDGFSEVIAKSILSGQYPISRLKYEGIDSYETEEELIGLLKNLKNKREPNYKIRQYYVNRINCYPWNKNK